MRFAFLAAVAASALAALAPGRASAAPIYTFTPVIDPEAPRYITVAQGINDAGQIVGTYSSRDPERPGTYNPNTSQGFLFDPASGAYATIAPPDAGNYNFTSGINDRGQIVGSYDRAFRGFFGFLRNPDGTYTTIAGPSRAGGTGALAEGINDLGQIVGSYYDGFAFRSFLRDPDGTYTILSDPIAARGQVYATGINDAGQIVGSYYDGSGSQGWHGFLREPDGTYTVVDGPSGSDYADAHGINDLGQIVGSYRDGSGVFHGFVRDPDGAYITLDDPGATTGGTTAQGINDLGQVVGAYGRSFGNLGFLATPVSAPAAAVPEPGSLAALGPALAGLLGLTLAARRRKAARSGAQTRQAVPCPAGHRPRADAARDPRGRPTAAR